MNSSYSSPAVLEFDFLHKIEYNVSNVVHYSSQINVFEDGAKNPSIVLNDTLYIMLFLPKEGCVYNFRFQEKL